MESYRVILQAAEGEYEEKKSRFIATVKSCNTEGEAVAFIDEMKKKYWDARHNCSAFVIGSRAELTRCSDDGEPGGTAGRPMLEVLLGSGVRNVCVVVTRYFGGVLLGTGGLVRAYTQAVKDALSKCETGMMRSGKRIHLTTDYNGIGRILYILGNEGVEPQASQYSDIVELELVVADEKVDKLQKMIIDATGGKASFEVKEEIHFVDKEESGA